jgi:hypothetical protein
LLQESLGVGWHRFHVPYKVDVLMESGFHSPRLRIPMRANEMMNQFQKTSRGDAAVLQTISRLLTTLVQYMKSMIAHGLVQKGN